jgi:hypothetical protein
MRTHLDFYFLRAEANSSLHVMLFDMDGKTIHSGTHAFALGERSFFSWLGDAGVSSGIVGQTATAFVAVATGSPAVKYNTSMGGISPESLPALPIPESGASLGSFAVFGNEG